MKTILNLDLNLKKMIVQIKWKILKQYESKKLVKKETFVNNPKEGSNPLT